MARSVARVSARCHRGHPAVLVGSDKAATAPRAARRYRPGMATASTQPDWLAPDVVDLAALARWGAAQGLPDGPLEDVRRIGGGTQNVVLHIRWAGRDLVLRRPPEHLRSSSNAVLLREMRVLRALAGTDVPHPALVAACTDESVLGGVVF
jgi:Phosphotransferase enzyme family